MFLFDFAKLMKIFNKTRKHKEFFDGILTRYFSINYNIIQIKEHKKPSYLRRPPGLTWKVFNVCFSFRNLNIAEKEFI